MKEERKEKTEETSYLDVCYDWGKWALQQAWDNKEIIIGITVFAIAAYSGVGMAQAATPVANANGGDLNPDNQLDEAYCYGDGYCNLRRANVHYDPVNNQNVMQYEYDLGVNNRGNPGFLRDQRFGGRTPVFHNDPNANNPLNHLDDINPAACTRIQTTL